MSDQVDRLRRTEQLMMHTTRQNSTKRRSLLVWDAPNIDMALGSVLGSKPQAKDRPQADALARWLIQRSPGAALEATIFVNMPAENATPLFGWISRMLDIGYRTFVKPKTSADSDVDDDMIRLIEKRHQGGDLEQLFVLSHDGARFAGPLKRLSASGVRTHAVIFPEMAHVLATTDGVEVIDLESIPGLFRSALPRLRYDLLPSDGRWFEPRRSIHDSARENTSRIQTAA
jgi:uncharacterized protein